MDSSDPPNMQSYPSPSAGADNNGPFYTTSSNSQQPELSHSDELAELQRDLAPIMHAGQNANIAGGQDLRGQSAMNHQHYESDNHAAGHMQARHALDQMADHYGTPDGSMAPRKRSKVSRACDECRRKKIRCDATGEDGKEQCTNCKRVGSRCQFSRVPMKRGPSKGYIKELADRLNTLEGAIQANEIPLQQQYMQNSPLQRHGSAEFSPSSHTEMSPRKRTYSSMSGEFNSSYQPPRQQPREWMSQDQPRHQLPHLSSAFTTPQSGPNMFREPNYSPNGLPPNAQWRAGPDPAHRGSSFDGIQAEHGHDYSVEWNEQLIDLYYKSIHTTYPILAHSKARLNATLATCSPAVKEAFYEAVYAAAQSFSAPNAAGAERRGTAKAVQIFALQSDVNSGGNLATNLVYLQTMMLMAIEAGSRGPATKSQAGPSQSAWLGSAVGLAYVLKLHSLTPSEKESDADSDDKLARRIWWCLVIMDKWHASSTTSPLLIPDRTAILNFQDRTLLGDQLYQLARLSLVLGHFSVMELEPVDSASYKSVPPAVYGMLFRGELERCREAFPESFFPPSNAPVIHLVYWFLRIMVELKVPTSELEDVLDPAMHIVTQLTHNSSLMSPLTHHATALAALTLIDLLGYEKTKDSAEAGLKALVENHIAPSGWDTAIRDLIINKLSRGASAGAGAAESQHALTASQGLQRLADLATATEGDLVDAAAVESRKDVDQANTGPVGSLTDGLKSLKGSVNKGYLSGFGA